jgi:hypothetical protein
LPCAVELTFNGAETSFPGGVADGEVQAYEMETAKKQRASTARVRASGLPVDDWLFI